MRRILSISLILLLWLPAFAVVLPDVSESRLPFCCRRNGAHHCAMSAEAATGADTASGQTNSPVFSAPSRCPQFPVNMAATTGPQFLGAGWAASGPALAVSLFVPGASHESARSAQLRTPSDRGPPLRATA